jgi:acetyl-CoA carboxylase biotin carboxyl carrier protein
MGEDSDLESAIRKRATGAGLDYTPDDGLETDRGHVMERRSVEPNEIRELIELISRSSFSTFELERDGFRIKLVKAEAGNPAVAGSPATGPVAVAEGPPATPAPTEGPEAVSSREDGLYELLSPIVGTFYRAPSPDASPYTEVGSHVSKGQVLCIVEAMKVMNEIESEIDAEVVEILIKNGQPVEFGEVMFRLRPS